MVVTRGGAGVTLVAGDTAVDVPATAVAPIWPEPGVKEAVRREAHCGPAATSATARRPGAAKRSDQGSTASAVAFGVLRRAFAASRRISARWARHSGEVSPERKGRSLIACSGLC